MNWVALPHNILERLEREGLSRDDRLLYVEGMLYASQNLTDGVVTARLPRLSDHPQPEDAAGRLVEAMAWELLEDGNYLVTDYFAANLTREEIDRRKEDARVRQERSRRHKVGDHSKCVRGRYCPEGALDPVTRDTTRDVTRESRHTLPTSPYLPDLTGKVGKGEGKQGADDGHGSPAGSPVAASPPHIYADPQRLGACQHCQLPERNAGHHHGAPKTLQRLAEQVADLGRLTPERSFDSTDHWWTAEARTDRVKWSWETDSVPLDQSEPQQVTWVDVKVDAELPLDAFAAWTEDLDADDAVKRDRLKWEAEGDDGHTFLTLRNPHWPDNGGDVTHHLASLRRHVNYLLTFPKAVQS